MLLNFSFGFLIFLFIIVILFFFSFLENKFFFVGWDGILENLLERDFFFDCLDFELSVILFVDWGLNSVFIVLILRRVILFIKLLWLLVWRWYREVESFGCLKIFLIFESFEELVYDEVFLRVWRFGSWIGLIGRKEGGCFFLVNLIDCFFNVKMGFLFFNECRIFFLWILDKEVVLLLSIEMLESIDMFLRIRLLFRFCGRRFNGWNNGFEWILLLFEV